MIILTSSVCHYKLCCAAQSNIIHTTVSSYKLYCKSKSCKRHQICESGFCKNAYELNDVEVFLSINVIYCSF